MNTLYLICFVLGLVLSMLAAFSGLGRLHLGHLHTGHIHTGHPGSTPTHKAGPGISAFNGFTIPAFLCWFGAAGYLMENYSSIVTPIVLILASVAGLIGASVLYATLFKILLPRERVLLPEDTRMEGTVARVSGEIRPNGHIGEILFRPQRRWSPHRARNRSCRAPLRARHRHHSPSPRACRHRSSHR
jgi:hypothetical protein